ncbi:MAG: hypothetical protein J6B16_01980 [Clostridia bacterium]|nr:hypothetical protein [Clostridia bacterium]
MSKNLSNKSILTELYQNAHTAMQSIKNLSPEVEDASVKCELITEYNRYQKIIDEINTLMDKYQVEKKDIGVFRKVSMAAAIKMKTFFSAKKKKVADMMIKGSVNGIIELTSIKNDNNLPEDIKIALNKLLSLEEQSIENFKAFL